MMELRHDGAPIFLVWLEGGTISAAFQPYYPIEGQPPASVTIWPSRSVAAWLISGSSLYGTDQLMGVSGESASFRSARQPPHGSRSVYSSVILLVSIPFPASCAKISSSA